MARNCESAKPSACFPNPLGMIREVARPELFEHALKGWLKWSISPNPQKPTRQHTKHPLSRWRIVWPAILCIISNFANLFHNHSYLATRAQQMTPGQKKGTLMDLLIPSNCHNCLAFPAVRPRSELVSELPVKSIKVRKSSQRMSKNIITSKHQIKKWMQLNTEWFLWIESMPLEVIGGVMGFLHTFLQLQSSKWSTPLCNKVPCRSYRWSQRASNHFQISTVFFF